MTKKSKPDDETVKYDRVVVTQNGIPIQVLDTIVSAQTYIENHQSDGCKYQQYTIVDEVISAPDPTDTNNA